MGLSRERVFLLDTTCAADDGDIVRQKWRFPGMVWYGMVWYGMVFDWYGMVEACEGAPLTSDLLYPGA